MKTCFVEGCDRISFARKWCFLHYQRWYRNGTVELFGRKNSERIDTPIDTSSLKSITGYLYLINTSGQIVNRKSGRQLKPQVNTRGYSVVRLSDGKSLKQFRVHRLLGEAFIPNLNNYPQINHINGNKLDNRLENLEWVTAKQNMQHKFKVLGYKFPERKKKKWETS